MANLSLGKAFALTSDGSGEYFIALSQTIISAGTAFISAGQSSSGIDVVIGGTLVVCQAEPPSRRPSAVARAALAAPNPKHPSTKWPTTKLRKSILALPP
jgi:hypothetical protein